MRMTRHPPPENPSMVLRNLTALRCRAIRIAKGRKVGGSTLLKAGSRRLLRLFLRLCSRRSGGLHFDVAPSD